MRESLTEPSYDEFRAALDDHAARAALGLYVTNAEARLLAANPAWSLTYFRQWLGHDVTADRGAPIAVPRAETPPTTRAVVPVMLPVAAESAPTVDDPPTASIPFVPLTVVAAPPARAAGMLAVLRRPVPVRLAATAVAASLVLAAVAASLTIALHPPGAAAPASQAGATDGAVAGDLPTLALPDEDAAVRTGDDLPAEDRLIADVTAALDLGAETTGDVPGLDAALRGQLLHTAEIACLSGVDDAMTARIAESVSTSGDLDAAAGARVAEAIRTYCAT